MINLTISISPVFIYLNSDSDSKILRSIIFPKQQFLIANIQSEIKTYSHQLFTHKHTGYDTTFSKRTGFHNRTSGTLLLYCGLALRNIRRPVRAPPNVSWHGDDFFACRGVPCRAPWFRRTDDRWYINDFTLRAIRPCGTESP